ncbi:MAG: class I SAM-dependent methyltransferase [Pseudomonadota bacterium]
MRYKNTKITNAVFRNFYRIISIVLCIIISSLQAKSAGLTDCFQNIYDENKWNGGSGPGSFPENTVGYREVLQDLISQEDIKSVSDVGCGDWQFMQLISIGADVTYTGYDVAHSIIDMNAQKFRAPNITFVAYSGDFTDIKPANLCVIKDVLQHLNKSYIDLFIKQMNKFRYVLITNCCESSDLAYQSNFNGEIQNGGWRPLDLTKAPYNLKMDLLLDYNGGGHKRVYLWKNPEAF